MHESPVVLHGVLDFSLPPGWEAWTGTNVTSGEDMNAAVSDSGGGCEE